MFDVRNKRSLTYVPSKYVGLKVGNFVSSSSDRVGASVGSSLGIFQLMISKSYA